jgi:Mg-chelatase subunit ChlD
LCFLLVHWLQAQCLSFVGVPENLGKRINDSLQQSMPALSVDGKTLFWLQLNQHKMWEVWQSHADTVGQWQAKQKADLPFQSSAKKNTVLYQFVQDNHSLIYQPSKPLLASFNWLNKKAQSLAIKDLGATSNASTMDAFYHAASRRLYLSIKRTKHYDLFYCDADTSVPYVAMPTLWQAPKPLSINSNVDEITPFLSADGQQLFFSSNRINSFGGFDIFCCQLLDAANMIWSEPENLGSTINSKGNETYFRIFGAKAYFCTNGAGFGRSDIYQIVLDQQKRADSPALVLNNQQQADTTARDFEKTKHKPNNIVFLLDRSNSMRKDKKFALLKKTMYQLIAKLRSVDKISLVTFSDQSEIFLEGVWVKNKMAIKETIENLEAIDASTNILDGLMDAYALAKKHRMENGNNQVFLVTDGVFKLSKEIENLLFGNSGIRLTAVMVGNAPNVQAFLQQIADRSKGQLIKLRNETQDINVLLDNVLMNSEKQ